MKPGQLVSLLSWSSHCSASNDWNLLRFVRNYFCDSGKLSLFCRYSLTVVCCVTPLLFPQLCNPHCPCNYELILLSNSSESSEWSPIYIIFSLHCQGIYMPDRETLSSLLFRLSSSDHIFVSPGTFPLQIVHITSSSSAFFQNASSFSILFSSSFFVLLSPASLVFLSQSTLLQTWAVP